MPRSRASALFILASIGISACSMGSIIESHDVSDTSTESSELTATNASTDSIETGSIDSNQSTDGSVDSSTHPTDDDSSNTNACDGLFNADVPVQCAMMSGASGLCERAQAAPDAHAGWKISVVAPEQLDCIAKTLSGQGWSKTEVIDQSVVGIGSFRSVASICSHGDQIRCEIFVPERFCERPLDDCAGICVPENGQRVQLEPLCASIAPAFCISAIEDCPEVSFAATSPIGECWHFTRDCGIQEQPGWTVQSDALTCPHPQEDMPIPDCP